jgi:hypothetical protein
MIEVIAEHSVEMSLLKGINANILDLGCRGFEFTDHLRAIGHTVIPVDIDHLYSGDLGYYQIAISDFNGKVVIKRDADPQATRIARNEVPIPNPAGSGTTSVECCTLEVFSQSLMVDFWDLIKMDIEGSEREVIMSMNRPMAKQLSIEFHLHTGVYGIQQVKEMEDKLTSLGYYPAKHDMTRQHGLGMNYWDSLWIVKGF